MPVGSWSRLDAIQRRLDAAPGDLPAMPEREDGETWTAEAARAWDSWWRSPMASAWLDADTVAVRRAVRLVDDAQRGRRGADAALVALLDRLGLTPAGRLRLQWIAETPRSPAPVATLPGRDPRERS